MLKFIRIGWRKKTDRTFCPQNQFREFRNRISSRPASIDRKRDENSDHKFLFSPILSRNRKKITRQAPKTFVTETAFQFSLIKGFTFPGKKTVLLKFGQKTDRWRQHKLPNVLSERRALERFDRREIFGLQSPLASTEPPPTPLALQRIRNPPRAESSRPVWLVEMPP